MCKHITSNVFNILHTHSHKHTYTHTHTHTHTHTQTHTHTYTHSFADTRTYTHLYPMFINKILQIIQMLGTLLMSLRVSN